MILSLLALLFSAQKDTLPFPDRWEAFDPVPVRAGDPPMSSLEGRVRVFIYFSPDCSHCRELWPHVQAEVAGLRSAGLVVGAIALRGQPREDVEWFAAEKGMDNPLWMDSTGSIADAWKIRSVPRAYVVARNGEVQVFRGLSPARLRQVLGIARRMALMH